MIRKRASGYANLQFEPLLFSGNISAKNLGFQPVQDHQYSVTGYERLVESADNIGRQLTAKAHAYVGTPPEQIR